MSMDSTMLENNILGLIIMDGTKLCEVALNQNHFTGENKKIWEAISEVGKTLPVDIISVNDYLIKKYKVEWISHLTNLAKNSFGCATDHSQRLTKISSEKQIRELFRSASQDENLNTDAVIGEAMSLSHSERSHMHEEMRLHQYLMKDIQEGKSRPCLNTGFENLDMTLGGFSSSFLYVFAGRPSMGKTALLLNMIVKSGNRGVFFSGEQDALEVIDRMTAIKTKIPLTPIRFRNLNNNQQEKIFSLAKNITDNIKIYDKPSMSIIDIQRESRKAVHKEGAEIIYIDYLQRIKPESKEKRNVEVGDVARALKDLAKELNVPVVSLAQLNRELTTRATKRPYISDLANSSEIENEADVIGLIHREGYYDESYDQKDVSIYADKNRHGPTGEIKLAWDGPTVTFEDAKMYGG